MRIKLKLLSIILFLTIFYSSKAQNLLDNHSFEEGEGNILIQPNEPYDFKHAGNWKTAENCNTFSGTCFSTPSANCPPGSTIGVQDFSWTEAAGEHAPHWFLSDRFLLEEEINGQYLQINAGEGRGYAGIYRGSLIQQRLDNRIEYDKSYKLKFKLRTVKGKTRGVNLPKLAVGSCYAYHDINLLESEWEDVKLNIYLASSSLDYKTNNSFYQHCNSSDYDKWIEKDEAKYFYKAATIEINLDAYPSGEWHDVELFLPPDALFPNAGFAPSSIDEPYDWIAFDIDHGPKQLSDPSTGYTGCNSPLLLLDDISLVEKTCHECFNCSNKDKCMNPKILNSVNDGFFECITVKDLDNVNHMIFEVYTYTWQFVHSEELTNPPKTFHWDHLLKRGTPDEKKLDNGTYWIYIKTRNDCQVKYTPQVVQVTSDMGCDNNTSITSNPPNPKVRTCCNEDLVIKNQVIKEDEFYKARNITIGPNVVIKSNTNITFRAQNTINFSPETVIENGANVEAYIQLCSVGDLEEGADLKKDKSNQISSNRIKDKKNQKLDNTSFVVYPNPNNGYFDIEIEGISQDIIYIEIVNTLGQVIYQNYTKFNSIRPVNLNGYASGLYVVRVKKGKNWLIPQKIIIQ